MVLGVIAATTSHPRAGVAEWTRPGVGMVNGERQVKPPGKGRLRQVVPAAHPPASHPKPSRSPPHPPTYLQTLCEWVTGECVCE